MRYAVFATLMLIAGMLPGIAGADQRDRRLTGLFDRLKVTQSELEARALEADIWRIWSETDDAEATALLGRGVQAMGGGNFPQALAVFNVVVQRWPDFAEGWNKRATVYFLMDQFEASVADIEKTLALEPRHFGALSGLGQIDLALGRKDAAIKVFGAALAIDPHLQGVKAALEGLKKESEGNPT
jgi:tetratricopeptide (TPR) repeat protein